MNTANNIQGSFCIVSGLAKVPYNNTFSRLKSSENALAEKEIINIVCIVHIRTPSCLKSRASVTNGSLVHFIFSVSHTGGAKQHHDKSCNVVQAERLV